MKTALFEKQKALGAQFTTFAGWEMPLYYQGIIQEHAAVRHKVGLFDVSHMGRILVSGKETLPYLDFLSVNTILGKALGTVVYTIFCDDKGFCLDDLLVYVTDGEQAFVVVNAVNRENILSHMQKVAKNFQVTINDTYADGCILSLQGPHATSLMQKHFPQAAQLPHMRHLSTSSITISSTGYTGEVGFEFYGTPKEIVPLWDLFLKEGAEPCGLGARDLLRMEMGYPLFGHELNNNLTPLDSLAAWVVKLDHDFFGKRALQTKSSSLHPLGLVSSGRLPARQGYPIFIENKKIGQVTSGTFSPSVQRPIALALAIQPVPHGTTIQVEIRDKRYPYETVALPFYKKK